MTGHLLRNAFRRGGNHSPLFNPTSFAYGGKSLAPSGRRLPVSRLNFLPQGSPGTIYQIPPRLAQQTPG